MEQAIQQVAHTDIHQHTTIAHIIITEHPIQYLAHMVIQENTIKI